MKQYVKRITANQKARYLITGGSSFVIEYSVFAVLFHLLNQLFVANSISFLCGLVYSFWLHKIWSFAGEHKHKTHKQFVGYATLAGINLVITNIAIGLLVNYASIPAMVAKVLTMILIVLWNYVFLSKILFKEAEAIPLE